MVMHVREKRIGGQSCYEIVEKIDFATGAEYRVIASLGSEAEPENARRRRHATLLGLESSLRRLEPLRAADPQIARKCDALNHRIDREQQKIVQLTNAIGSLDESPEGRNENRNRSDNIKALKLVSNGPAAKARPEPGG